MKMTLDGAEGAYQIRSYGPGQVQVNEAVYAASLVLSPDTLISDWAPRRFADLDTAHMDTALELEPEVVLLGTGARQQFPSRELMLALISRGIGLEVMDTASACRTYNILMAEGRKVVAALIVEP